MPLSAVGTPVHQLVFWLELVMSVDWSLMVRQTGILSTVECLIAASLGRRGRRDGIQPFVVRSQLLTVSNAGIPGNNLIRGEGDG